MTSPTPPVNYQLLRLYIDTIPQFDGNPNTLGIFIENCESLIHNFATNPNDTTLNSFILRAIISKLCGRALSLIGSRIELTKWSDIRNALKLSFGDQRNIDCLLQDLIMLRPLKNENSYNFGIRCQDARSLIISKINALEISTDQKILRIQNFDDIALKTFIRGLSGAIQNNIRLRNPDSLEKAMSLVIEEENFLYSQNINNTLNTQQSVRPFHKITPTGTIQKPNYPNVQKPNYQNFQRPNYQNVQRPNYQNFQKPFTTNTGFMPRTFQNPIQNYQSLPRPMPQQNQLTWKPNNNFQFPKPPYFSQRPSQIRRFNQPSQFANNSNQVKNMTFKQEPMEIGSGTSRFTQKQPKYPCEELFLQNVDNPDEQVENQVEFDENDDYETEYYPDYEYNEIDFDPNLPEYQIDQSVNFLKTNIDDHKT